VLDEELGSKHRQPEGLLWYIYKKRKLDDSRFKHKKYPKHYGNPPEVPPPQGQPPLNITINIR
jgi:hypothetical protein